MPVFGDDLENVDEKEELKCFSIEFVPSWCPLLDGEDELSR